MRLSIQAIRLGPNLWRVTSESRPQTYEISQEIIGWVCTCADHTYRLRPCKHIRAVWEAEG